MWTDCVAAFGDQNGRKPIPSWVAWERENMSASALSPPYLFGTSRRTPRFGSLHPQYQEVAVHLCYRAESVSFVMSHYLQVQVLGREVAVVQCYGSRCRRLRQQLERLRGHLIAMRGESQFHQHCVPSTRFHLPSRFWGSGVEDCSIKLVSAIHVKAA